ncbi:MAG: ABC transporter permease subunit, partial [Pygmaiobacter sp.]
MNLLNIISQLLGGLGNSLLIFALTLIFSLPLGLLVTFGRMSKWNPLRFVVKIFISILRGTPLMLQLLVVFFAPYYLFGAQLSAGYRFFAVIIGFS